MKTLLSFVFMFCVPAATFAQITVTAPVGTVTVASADDFATRAFQDPWDMNQRTDFGWFLQGTDLPSPGLTNLSFTNGIFSAKSTNNDPSLFLLESSNPNMVPRIQKDGSRFPIDANKYKILAFRMQVATASAIQLIWNAESLYDGATKTASAIATTPGYRIYVQSIPAMTLTPSGTTWGGTVRALRFDPTVLPDENIDIDWIRLVNDDPALYRTITWTGGGAVDIHLDNDNNGANGNLGVIAKSVSGGSYSFYVGALAPGSYYVAINNGGSFAYSPGSYLVNETPTLSFISPSEEGSSDDFATNVLGNPWDMDALTDFDIVEDLSTAMIRSDLKFEDEAGGPVGQQLVVPCESTSSPCRVFYGVSAPPPAGKVGDPRLYLMRSDKRGFNNRIDPDRYRIVTIAFGIPNKARNYNIGAAGRVIWKVAGELVENVSGDIFVNSRAGANVMNKVSMDMKDVPLFAGGSPSTTGWNKGTSGNPGLDNFRFDPHEYDPTPFYVQYVKLAALEKANTSYTINWRYSKNAGTIQFFRSTDQNGANQTAISGVLSAAMAADANAVTAQPGTANATTGSYVWNTTGVPNGTYHILAVFSDGVNSNQTYARWPLVIDGISELPLIKLNRSKLNFGSLAGGSVKTAAQTVRVTVTGPGSGCWSVAIPPAPRDFVTVTPSSGCGSGTFTVTLKNLGYSGTAEGSLTVTGGFSNSPQYVQYWVRIAPGATPGGSVDTPVNNVNVAGSIAATGWVLDDIEVTSVQIYRDAVAGEPPGEKFVGDAVLVDDVRPDIELANPDSPFNYRAGWGYLLLTNMLPNQGNGTFVIRIYANDREGHKTLMGSRTLDGQNASSTFPFGAIDTPGQGAVISGNAYVNFGWVLTPQPKIIPIDGSTINVLIDNVVVGHPTYNQYRSDIAGLFPGLRNTDGAVGFFVIDTTKYANGVHTISWTVTDSAGVVSGIGSRYFTIAN